jgi:hypothetical protein
MGSKRLDYKKIEKVHNYLYVNTLETTYYEVAPKKLADLARMKTKQLT